MNIGLYQGAASLSALERMQEIVAQNISAAAAPGFRKTEVSFQSVLGGAMHAGGDGRSAKDAPGVMPTPVTRISMQPGELRSTGNEFDFAIQGAGFFQIQRPNGETGYTRDGEFHVSPERTLVNKTGFPVLSDGGPLSFKPGGGRVTVNAEGNILQGETLIGKIAVTDFGDPAKLVRIGEGLLAPATGDARPTAVERPSVLSGTLESGNVTPLHEMVNLIQLSRAYEASQRVVLAHDESMDRAIQALGNPTT